MASVNQNAVEFIERWKDKGDERQHSQRFWIDLLESVFEVKNVSQFVQFEERVKQDNTTYMDIYIPKTKVIVEQKGKKIDLRKKQYNSDLTPFEQAEKYNRSLPHSLKARWIVTCNFQTFLIYDMENDPNGLQPLELKLEDLATKYNELRFLVEYQDQKIIEEQKLSIKAGELIGRIYDLLQPQYKDPENPNTLKSLNKLCVRLVFCLYAEDAGLFDRNDNHIFGNYLKKTETKHLRKALIDLFTVLNQDPDKNKRDPYLEDDLARFPYVNGNLFKIESPETDEIPNFTDELKHLLIEECSESFDWADISPTIFGALFESTLNPDTRRSCGMHYTSIENIHKVIDPLFLDDLKAEFEELKKWKTEKKINQEFYKFQQKLSSLKFLDPACGSGNFLTETYLCIRRLENELILFQSKNQSFLSFENPVKVSISQFYGIEINDFAVAVANTALWIAESQMLHETENIIHREIDFLPLKTNSNIHQGNALRMDWEQIVPKSELNYIMGNPPFVGTKYQSKQQKDDVLALCKNYKSIDYVACWYKIASDFITNTNIKCAFVSTNSISQGEQVSIFQSELSINILFAYRTFNWNSEVLDKAHVHCVIIGFATKDYTVSQKFIISENNKRTVVNNINGYLLDGPDVLIFKRSVPICNFVQKMTKGSQPTDGGNLLLNKEEKDFFDKKYPEISPYIKRYMGANDLINNIFRYCFWLKKCPPNLIRAIPELKARIDNVKESRLQSTKIATQRDAERPTVFTEDSQPDTDYIILPVVSSQNRKYIPTMYVSKEVIANANAQMIPGGNLYTFGIIHKSLSSIFDFPRIFLSENVLN